MAQSIPKHISSLALVVVYRGVRGNVELVSYTAVGILYREEEFFGHFARHRYLQQQRSPLPAATTVCDVAVVPLYYSQTDFSTGTAL